MENDSWEEREYYIHTTDELRFIVWLIIVCIVPVSTLLAIIL